MTNLAIMDTSRAFVAGVDMCRAMNRLCSGVLHLSSTTEVALRDFDMSYRRYML
jgi:hypothetical protein